MKQITTLNEAFIIKLQSLYDIENELTKALPKMAKNATDSELKKAFEDHLKETKEHVTRLEKIFKSLDMKVKKTKVEAIRGLVADAEWVIKEKPEKVVLDPMLIGAAAYVEHYEMAGYEVARRWAEKLGYTDVVDMLQMTLEEEQKAAELMSQLGDERLDEQALGEEEVDAD
jgi:ferritin-like metal-binding protein YciE